MGDALATQLVDRYLRAFGPATEADVVWWTGLGKRRIQAALGELAGRTARIRAEGIDDELILLRSELDNLRQDTPHSAPSVHLLPYLDGYLMGYIDRARYLHPTHRDWVYDKTGNATSIIMLRGRVVGTWDYEERGGPLVKLHLFHRLEPGLKDQVRHKAAEVGRFLAGGATRICECPAMVPLPQRTAGSFMSPLKGQTSEVQ